MLFSRETDSFSAHRGLLVPVFVKLPAVSKVLSHVVAGLALAVDKVLVEPPSEGRAVLHFALVVDAVADLEAFITYLCDMSMPSYDLTIHEFGVLALTSGCFWFCARVDQSSPLSDQRHSFFSSGMVKICRLKMNACYC